MSNEKVNDIWKRVYELYQANEPFKELIHSLEEDVITVSCLFENSNKMAYYLGQKEYVQSLKYMCENKPASVGEIEDESRTELWN